MQSRTSKITQRVSGVCLTPFPCLRRGYEGLGSHSLGDRHRVGAAAAPFLLLRLNKLYLFKKRKTTRKRTPRFGVKEGFVPVPVVRALQREAREGSGVTGRGQLRWPYVSAFPSGAGGSLGDASEGADAASIIASGCCSAPRKPHPCGQAASSPAVCRPRYCSPF